MSELLCPMCKIPISQTEVHDCERRDIHATDCRLYIYLCANGHRLKQLHFSKTKNDRTCCSCEREASMISYRCTAGHTWNIDPKTGERTAVPGIIN